MEKLSDEEIATLYGRSLFKVIGYVTATTFSIIARIIEKALIEKNQ